MRVRSSGAIGRGPGLPVRRERRRQYVHQPWRCHCSTVSGITRRRDVCQPLTPPTCNRRPMLFNAVNRNGPCGSQFCALHELVSALLAAVTPIKLSSPSRRKGGVLGASRLVKLVQLRKFSLDVNGGAVVGTQCCVQVVSHCAMGLHILQSLNAGILVAKHSAKGADHVRRRCRPLFFCLNM